MSAISPLNAAYLMPSQGILLPTVYDEDFLDLSSITAVLVLEKEVMFTTMI